MSKHIIGFIIFSFIIGVTAFLASFFVIMPTLPTLDPVPKFGYIDYESGRHCKGKKRKPRPKAVDQSASVKVTQAFFDAKSKRLETQFAIERADESTETVNVALQFFVYDDFGVQHIADEFVSLEPNFDMGDIAVTNNSSSFRWLNNLQSRENLYVIAKATNNSRYLHNPVDFDPSEATAVLLKPAVAGR
jgi:hypothetical protein